MRQAGILLACGSGPTYGQNPSTPQVADRFSKVRAMIQDVLQKGGAASLSIAVAESG